ncbi:LTA synthase family protein [Paenibacillus lautus]|uniref:LTA synthase family protein n=1 Tax=Paenibacillus lautus TaxID=1401 RepID=UPI001BCF6FCE|nr:LTA synthase family protein [Paenibacillus lautus]
MLLLRKFVNLLIAIFSGWFILLILDANIRSFFLLFLLITFSFYIIYSATWEKISRADTVVKSKYFGMLFIIVCMVLSNYILFKDHIVLSSWNINEIVIEPSNLKNAESKGNEIWIDRITIDTKERDITTQNFNTGWLVRENQLMTMGDNPSSYQSDLDGNYKLVVSLRNHPWSGFADITINNTYEYSINLYNGEVDKTVGHYSFITLKYIIFHNIFIALILFTIYISLATKIGELSLSSRIRLFVSFSLTITSIVTGMLLYFELEQAWWKILDIIVISMCSSFLFIEFINEFIGKLKRNFVKQTIIVFFLSLFVLLIVEIINGKSPAEAFVWTVDSWETAAISLIILSLLLLILMFITNTIVVSFILVSITFVSLAAINYYKALIRSDVLVPWDLALFAELGKINREYSFSLHLPIVFSGIFLVVLLFYYFYFFEYKLSVSRKNRLVGVVLSITVVMLLIGTIISSSMILKMNISEDELDQSLNYSNNGFIFGFIRNMSKTIKEPDNYNPKKMNSLINTLHQNMIEDYEEENVNVKPNIILILNESYWDLGKLEKVKYNITPNHLMNSEVEGIYILNLQVPQFAAGTANTEYEVLTSMDTANYPIGVIPYKSYIKENTSSLVSYLKEQGYYTVALHPYYADFYNRRKVYDYLGFDKKLFIDDIQEVDNSLTYFKNYVSDESLFNNIVKQYQEHKMSGKNASFFNFTATMQNHSPYTEEIGDKTINIVDDFYSDTTKTILENYGEGIFRTDTALNKLYNYFSNQDEPTIIVSFGDHLPGLGDVSPNGFTNVYHETGFLQNDDKNHDKMYTTPLLIWSNFSLKTDHFTEETIINSEDLLPFVFSISGMRQPLYYQFVNNSRTADDSTSDIKNMRWLIQYDYQFGSGLIKKEIWK